MSHYTQIATHVEPGYREVVVMVCEPDDDRVVESYVSVNGEPALRRLGGKPSGPFFNMAQRAFNNYSGFDTDDNIR